MFANLESEIKGNDKIEFAQNGSNAKPYIKDYINKLDSIGFYLNDEVKNLEPLFFINDHKVDIEHNICEGDNIKTVFPNTIGDYRKFFDDNLNLEFYMETVKLQDDYIIKEGDRIFTAVTGNKIDEKINNGYDYKDGINCAQLEVAADYVENQKEISIIQKVKNHIYL